MVFFVRITVNQSHLRPICKSTKFNPKIQRTIYLINFQQLRLHVPDFIRTVVKEHIKVVPYKADGKEKTGQSAMIDLSIHNDKFDRIALIEFKALNPEESAFAKDFCKLSNEPTCLTFFIMIVKSHDNGTITNIHKKIESKGAETEFYCFDLEKGEDISKKIIDGISSSENK